MEKKIAELNLNEIDAVTGGATYATLSTSASLIKPTYVKPTYTATAWVAPTSSTLLADRLI
jgi:hypothetical protein